MVAEVRDAVGREARLLLGSGVRLDNAPALLEHANGAIVGSALKVDGELAAPVDAQRVADLVRVVRAQQS